MPEIISSQSNGMIRPLGKRGFTLLEALLAASIFTIGSVLLLQVMSMGLFGGGINETELVALSLAQEKVESIRNTAYASVANEAKAVVSGFSSFQRAVTVTTPQTDLKQVTVTVYYTVKGTELGISMVTYVSNI